MMDIEIKLTKHAKMKMAQRRIAIDQLKKVIYRPEREEEDRFDQSLTHFIGSIEGKFLRIIGRREKKSKVLVISAFFDRRLSRGRK